MPHIDQAVRDRLIVALDFPDAARARSMVRSLGETVGCYKIGLELLFGGGLDLAQELVREGRQVFLDMKLLDISNTVEKATANIAGLGVNLLTVHGHDRKTLDAAVRGRGSSGLQLLSVTVMTHLEERDLAEQGTDRTPADLALHRACMAREAGFDGVIASAQEAGAIRERLGADFLIVCPGIRPAGADAGDQARIMTASGALAAGADRLVIGRPITQAASPNDAALAILGEMADARPLSRNDARKT